MDRGTHVVTQVDERTHRHGDSRTRSQPVSSKRTFAHSLKRPSLVAVVLILVKSAGHLGTGLFQETFEQAERWPSQD